MSSNKPRIGTAVALVLAACAVAVPSASGDMRDAVDVLVTPSTPAQTDLRSPDVRDLAVAVPATRSRADLRSPDTRDAADGRIVSAAPPVRIVRISDPGAFDWGDAGVGAGAMFALILVGFGGLLLVTHRRWTMGRSDGQPTAH
jgi:hypothetical protein